MPLGRPQMRGEHHGRAVIERVPDRRQRSPDARVVGDAAVLERDVEVDTDEHPLAGEIEIAKGPLHNPFFAMKFTRSTHRLE